MELIAAISVKKRPNIILCGKKQQTAAMGKTTIRRNLRAVNTRNASLIAHSRRTILQDIAKVSVLVSPLRFGGGLSSAARCRQPMVNCLTGPRDKLEMSHLSING